MANTTSGTATFDKTFAIDEIVEESFERIGLQNVAGYQLKSARRSLNVLFQEWGNRGIHYWEIADTNIDLVEGQSDYDFFRSSDDGTSATTTPTNGIYGMSDVLEAQLRSNRTQTTQADSPMTKVDRSTYAGFSNKLSKGTPNQYWVERFIDKLEYTFIQHQTLRMRQKICIFTTSTEFKMLVIIQTQQMFHLDLFLVWFQV